MPKCTLALAVGDRVVVTAETQVRTGHLILLNVCYVCDVHYVDRIGLLDLRQTKTMSRASFLRTT